jgi:hypothetical protein
MISNVDLPCRPTRKPTASPSQPSPKPTKKPTASPSLLSFVSMNTGSGAEPTTMPSSLPISGIGSFTVAAIVLCGIISVFVIIGPLVWLHTRKVVAVTSLPTNINEHDLLAAFPGASLVQMSSNGTCAYVHFATHPDAQNLIDRSKKERIYCQNSALSVRFAYPWCLESFCAEQHASTAASKGEVRSQFHVDEL